MTSARGWLDMLGSPKNLAGALGRSASNFFDKLPIFKFTLRKVSWLFFFGSVLLTLHSGSPGDCKPIFSVLLGALKINGISSDCAFSNLSLMFFLDHNCAPTAIPEHPSFFCRLRHNVGYLIFSKRTPNMLPRCSWGQIEFIHRSKHRLQILTYSKNERLKTQIQTSATFRLFLNVLVEHILQLQQRPFKYIVS